MVVDAHINPGRIEMYAAPGAQGGVLEPEGVAEIKFRERELLAFLRRTDPTLASLRAAAAGGALEDTRRPCREAAQEREKKLLPQAQQVFQRILLLCCSIVHVCTICAP